MKLIWKGSLTYNPYDNYKYCDGITTEQYISILQRCNFSFILVFGDGIKNSIGLISADKTIPPSSNDAVAIPFGDNVLYVVGKDNTSIYGGAEKNRLSCYPAPNGNLCIYGIK